MNVTNGDTPRMSDMLRKLGRDLDNVEPLPERTQRPTQDPVTGHSGTTHISLGSIETVCVHMLETIQRLSSGAVAACRVKRDELERLYNLANEDYERAVAFDERVKNSGLEVLEHRKKDG